MNARIWYFHWCRVGRGLDWISKNSVDPLNNLDLLRWDWHKKIAALIKPSKSILLWVSYEPKHRAVYLSWLFLTILNSSKIYMSWGSADCAAPDFLASLNRVSLIHFIVNKGVRYKQNNQGSLQGNFLNSHMQGTSLLSLGLTSYADCFVTSGSQFKCQHCCHQDTSVDHKTIHQEWCGMQSQNQPVESTAMFLFP